MFGAAFSFFSVVFLAVVPGSSAVRYDVAAMNAMSAGISTPDRFSICPSLPAGIAGTCSKDCPTLCEIVMDINGESASFSVCTDAPCENMQTADITSSSVDWTAGLWSKFIKVHYHWDTQKISDIASQFNLMRKGMPRTPGMSTLDQIQAWVNEMTAGIEAVKYRWSKTRALVSSQGHAKPALPDRQTWEPYASRPWKGRRILIVGAGPIGLRMAIEGKLMGASVVRVVESRNNFARANVMKMWPIAREDLESIGLKEFRLLAADENPQVPIALMQHALLRLALIMGVRVSTNVEFKGLEYIAASSRWEAIVAPTGADGAPVFREFDVIIDATGARGHVATTPVCGAPLMKRTTQKRGQKKVAISVNWKRFNGDTDKSWAFGEPEITAVGQKMIQYLNTQPVLVESPPRVQLSDLVYFQSKLSNYVVMAIDVAKLAPHEVFKNDAVNTKKLLKPENINSDKLLEVATMVSQDWRLPHEEGKMLGGINKLSVFEFTDLHYTAATGTETASTVAALPAGGCDGLNTSAADRVLAEDPKDTQLLMSIGDALWAPFWPEGTGMSRGILSVYHAGFTLQGMWSSTSAEGWNEAYARSLKWTSVGTRAQPTDCKDGRCTTKMKFLKNYVAFGYGADGKNVPPTFRDALAMFGK